MTNESFKKFVIDNSLVVLNRFILLDPLMLFFISATVFSMAHFNKQKRYHIYHLSMIYYCVSQFPSLIQTQIVCMTHHYTTFVFFFHRSFSFRWWFWLSSTGIFMAGSFSIKFVGLFLVFLVGIRAIYDLWIILGDMSRPVVKIYETYAQVKHALRHLFYF